MTEKQTINILALIIVVFWASSCGTPTRKWKTQNERLHFAAFQGDLSEAQLAISEGADINSTIGISEDRPIHKAAYRGNAIVLSYLLASGADINARSSGGFTALHNAVGEQQLECINILIAKGADVNARTSSDATPLKLAISLGYSNIAEILRKAGGVE